MCLRNWRLLVEPFHFLFKLEKSTLTLRTDGRVEGGGGTDRQTDKRTLQLCIVDIYI